MSFVWTQEAIDLLHRFYLSEGLSAAQTAAALHSALGGSPTRNAVLGKAQRMGWCKPAVEPKPPPPARPFGPLARRGPIRRPWNGPDTPLPPLREAPLRAAPKPWCERQPGECAYPIGEPAAPGMQLCCGAPTGGGAYCPPHRELMTVARTALTTEDQAAILAIARRAA
jgi:hypothetical protein